MDEPQQRPEYGHEDWNLIKELFYQYQEEAPQDPSSWLMAKCPSDTVRREVERLIRAGGDLGTFLEKSASQQYLGAARPHPVQIGRYRIIQELGSGGLGVVYAAWDETLQRRVALKVLQSKAIGDPELRKRLLWDAKAAGGLQHPNIVVIHEIGSDGGQDYVAMECVTGRTLGQLIQLQPGGLETRLVLNYAVQIARGLEAAHSAGIVHRDLKPGNIMITDDGVVKLLDFGLAKTDRGVLGGPDVPVTIEGRFAGTVAYVSPEQAEGRTVDARSDIFSFGCVLFEMLTGRQAFQGETALSVLASILQGEPPGLLTIRPVLDYHFDEIVRGCLRKEPAQRFQSMKVVRQRLDELVQDETVELPHARPKRRPTWHKYALAAACVVIAFAAGVAGGWRLKPAASTSDFAVALRRRVTFDSGLSGYPAISPNGQSVVYASDRAGKASLNIWMQLLSGGEPRPLTFGTSDDYDPVFSPDGQRIVYRSERGSGGIYETPWLTPSDRLLIPQGRGPQFSPDGSTLAYWKGDPGASFYQGSAGIFLIPAQGGAPKQILNDFDAAAYPVWSPRGDSLLFLGKKGDSKVEWWVGSTSGKESHPTGILEKFRTAWGMNPQTGQYYAVPAAWLPQNIVLFSAARGDSTNIWAVRVDEGGRPVEAPRLWTAGTGVESQPSASQIGGQTTLAYAALSVGTAVWRVALKSSGEASGLPEPLVTGFGEISSPSISADGSKLSFGSSQQGLYSIRLLDIPSAAETLVQAVHSRNVVRPVLSGDGRTLAYRAGDGKAFVMGIGNSVSEPICDNCGPTTDITSDGSQVLLESPSPPERIMMARRGHPAQPLLAGVQGADQLMQYAGRFSPDRKWVAFHGVSQNSSDRRIYVAPVPHVNNSAGGVTPVSEGPTDIEPTWSPDGKRIYFLSKRDGFECVWARNIDLDGRPVGDVFSVTHFDHARRIVRGPRAYSGQIGLSAARDFLVLTVAETTGNVWLQTMPSR